MTHYGTNECLLAQWLYTVIALALLQSLGKWITFTSCLPLTLTQALWNNVLPSQLTQLFVNDHFSSLVCKEYIKDADSHLKVAAWVCNKVYSVHLQCFSSIAARSSPASVPVLWCYQMNTLGISFFTFETYLMIGRQGGYYFCTLRHRMWTTFHVKS